MARRVITKQLYDAIVAAFRIHPGNMRKASSLCGVDQRTAARAWKLGWLNEKSKPWARPVSEVIAEENEAAKYVRVKALEAQAIADEAMLAARQKQATNTLDEEYRSVSITRQATLVAAGGALPPLIKGATAMATRLEHELANGEFTTPQRLGMLKQTTIIIKNFNEAVRIALENERVRMGQPTQVIGLTTGKLTAEEAAEELQNVFKSLGVPIDDTNDATTKH